MILKLRGLCYNIYLYQTFYASTAWFEYWLENIKGDSIRPNTIRNYRERFEHNIKGCIGNMILSDVKPMHCQNVLNQMKDKYRTTTI